MFRHQHPPGECPGIPQSHEPREHQDDPPAQVRPQGWEGPLHGGESECQRSEQAGVCSLARPLTRAHQARALHPAILGDGAAYVALWEEGAFGPALKG